MCHVALALLLSATTASGQENLAATATATASNARDGYVPANAVDGVISDESRWLSHSGRKAWLLMDLGVPKRVTVAHVFTGYQDASAVRSFDLEYRSEDGWELIPGGRVRGNSQTRLVVEFTHPVSTSAVRFVNRDPSQVARVREIALYEDASVAIGTGLADRSRGNRPEIDPTRHLVVVNQVGYQTSWPKRFTAPLSPDGALFAIRESNNERSLFRGVVRNGLGDFTGFRPADGDVEFLIEVSGKGLKSAVSDPFSIREDLYQEQFWQAAVDFMIDSRSVVGTHPSAYGGSAWRDGTYYDFVVPSLVLLYLSDPEFVESMPKQLDWHYDKKRILSKDFQFDAKTPHSDGVLDAARGYYADLEPPHPGAPDVIKLIHWGLGYYLLKPASKDPSGDPEPWKVQGQTVEQFAFLLWAWPRLELDRWLDKSFYDRCQAFVSKHWEESGLLENSKWWDPATYQSVSDLMGPNPMGGYLHPYKGRHAPGHSILPNLLMYEVTNRSGLPNSERYLHAAQKQTEWLIKNIDWNDPRSTKGHRMSEHKTVPGLVWFLQNYPDHAPPDLPGFIEKWAQVAVSRSNNMWDFRRFDLGEHWTIPKLNEPGNLAGFPACALSASWVVKDPELVKRLRQLAVAQFDNLFGRNPIQAAAPGHPENGFRLVERGWPKLYPKNVCARIELCRGALCASPGSEMYPLDIDGKFRHPEGWVNFNAAWNVGLAYFAWDQYGRAPFHNGKTRIRTDR
ncbi:secreted protein containing Coagulation factor 5/8 type [Rhodopirellula sallentina SM41]|uniref:Secreted protein containing Coagulation factor 5/8 type n=1 Tax=Rhodopirellula sallentina SM41 TaxID=1263870 RepID=M5UAA7_9BACT|nr:secreted protein containing Coagulation factor 5/8 type [Rhodopirellula sallentina SM41]